MENADNAFVGHYVVLVGVSYDAAHVQEAMKHDSQSPWHDDTKLCLAVKNPGSGLPVSYFTMHHFERAWRTPGTDDDIIFVVMR